MPTHGPSIVLGLDERADLGLTVHDEHPLVDDEQVARHVPVCSSFVVQNYEPVELERETVNDLLGYEGSFWPQGLWRVSDDQPGDPVVRQFGV